MAKKKRRTSSPRSAKPIRPPPPLDPQMRSGVGTDVSAEKIAALRAATIGLKGYEGYRPDPGLGGPHAPRSDSAAPPYLPTSPEPTAGTAPGEIKSTRPESPRYIALEAAGHAQAQAGAPLSVESSFGATQPNDDFSPEPSPDREVWVKHRASGIVFKFTISGDNTIDEGVYLFNANPASDIDAASLFPAAVQAARAYVTSKIMEPPAAELRLDITSPSLREVPAIELIPQQARAASQFALDASGRIDLIPDPPDQAVLADSEQRELYADLRDKAQELFELGHNQLGDLSGPTDQFRAALPQNIEAVSITRLWSRGNTLRRRLGVHDIASKSTDPTTPGRLVPSVTGALQDLVETFNVFIFSDPIGRELDQIRLGPQERNTARAVVDVAVPLVEAVRESTIATRAAVEALTEQIEAARGAVSSAPGVNSDQAIELGRKTSSNFVAELLRRAYMPLRPLAGAILLDIRTGIIGGAAWAALVARPELIKAVAENAEKLKSFVDQAFHNPAIEQIIDIIVRAYGRMH
jgi:hypothetical protein